MLTSHDDGYQDIILTSGMSLHHSHAVDNLDESMLDDEEEWRANSDGEESEEEGLDEEDGEEAEMVIECPFEEPKAALLDLSHEDAPLESPRISIP
ncbi:hypothetical protein PSACC_03539 [Paramicrosporidium saccamoebae]|uniref:Uncharacterized protein n=1 Tax=Paramicrosporidium saccamoebae TaxID=1246581 RepID=A0A2H9TFR3_9FUNG|nr:hypothetical protein PSACC_03539 [Paramicrosporidium saccamoebae]